LNENGGFSNAFTCEEHTNYFFDVNPDGLYGALDRFAQFFIAPLFDPSGTEREMRAVDSENKKNLNNDHWRLNQLEKHLASPNHPYHKFGTGNLETLNVPAIRETLMSFHARFYSANLMKLVVYGRESLDQMQNWVCELFSAVKNASVSRPEWPGLPFDPSSPAFKASQLVRVKTLKEMRSMSVSWLIPDQRPHYRTKPDHYLTHLIGHEGEGSLFQALKKRGWLTNLSAGCENDAHGYGIFQISFELSPLGWEQYEQVLAWMTQYLAALKHWGPQQRIFSECQQLNALGFKFREKGDPSSFTHQLATYMQSCANEPRLMLAGPFITEVYDADCIADLLAHLAPERMRVTLASSIVQDEKMMQEPWYGTEYTAAALDLIPAIGDLSQELYLPAANPFIPQTLNFSVAAEEAARFPVRLMQEEAFTLWYKQDDTFELPKSQVNLFFRSRDGLISSSALANQSASLFKDLLKHTLILYDATLAGLKYEFAALAEGFEIKIFGFSEKIPVLLETILKAILKPGFSQVDFDVVRDRQLRSLKNFPREAPYWHASFHLNGLIAEPFHPVAARIEALQSMNGAEWTAAFNAPGYFFQQISNSGPVEMLVHGSFGEGEAQSLAGLVKSFLPQPGQSSTWRQRIVDLPRGDICYCPPASSALDNPNCAVEVFFALGSLEDVRLRTLASIFAQIFSESFFDTLRTNEQLGYIVTHGSREKGVLAGLRFLIQSERDPHFLDDRIEVFLAESVPSVLDALTPAAWNQHCTALRLELTQKKKTLAGEAKCFWDAILSGSCDFERNWLNAQLLDGVQLEQADLRSFFEMFLKKGAQGRRKICVQIWNAEASGNGKLTDKEIVVDRDAFVGKQAFYPATYKVAEFESENYLN
jgi:insulysin